MVSTSSLAVLSIVLIAIRIASLKDEGSDAADETICMVRIAHRDSASGEMAWIRRYVDGRNRVSGGRTSGKRVVRGWSRITGRYAENTYLHQPGKMLLPVFSVIWAPATGVHFDCQRAKSIVQPTIKGC